eukprot:g3481.t1
MVPGVAREGGIADFRWKNRLLVVSEAGAEFVRAAEAVKDGLGERDLLVFVLDGEGRRKFPAGEGLRGELMERFRVEGDGARVWLIGKDGKTAREWKVEGFRFEEAFELLMSLLALFLAAFAGYFAFGLEAPRKKAIADYAAGVGANVLNAVKSRNFEVVSLEAPLPGNVEQEAYRKEIAREATYDNLGHPWPKAARPERNPRHKVISEDHEKGVFVYESPGYYFYADSPIAYDASMHFATLFETTKAFMKSLPLGLLKADAETGRSKVLIFGTDSAYSRSGGPPNSAGCYIPGKRYVLVPVSSLELRKTAKGFERDQQKDHKVLIHELAHQLTPAAYYAHGSVGWFSEGLAEYVGTTPYRPGYFWVDPHGNSAKEYATAYGDDGRRGRVLGTTISVPPLEDFMLMSYDRFTGGDANRNYGVALLLTYYFFHMEGGGGAKRITAFLKGLKEGKYGAEALIPLHVTMIIAQGRVWTTALGRSFEAEFVQVSGANVLFKDAGGRRFTVAVRELGRDDQEMVRKLAGRPLEAVHANFGRPWPREARMNGNPACKTVSEDTAKGVYIYESPGYRFYADARITHDALANFATVFESTRAFLSVLPISMLKGETATSRSRVLLFGEEEGYYRSGGMRGSAGCYIPKNRLVLVPMSSLGLEKGGTGFGRDLTKNDRILVHELVHQLTPSAYFAHGALGWFSEGLAEYVAATPYHTGYFRVDAHGNAVKEYVCAYGEDRKLGRALGEEITAPPLKDFMLMGYGAEGGKKRRGGVGTAPGRR